LHYRQALDIYPQYATAALGMGGAYELKGDVDEARHWYGEAARLDPGLAAEGTGRAP
jgi:tetratricopeptide (TPR) repeat protein